MWRRIHVCHTMQLSVSSIYLSIYLPPTYVPIYLYDDVMHAQDTCILLTYGPGYMYPPHLLTFLSIDRWV